MRNQYQLIAKIPASFNKEEAPSYLRKLIDKYIRVDGSSEEIFPGTKEHEGYKLIVTTVEEPYEDNAPFLGMVPGWTILAFQTLNYKPVSVDQEGNEIPEVGTRNLQAKTSEILPFVIDTIETDEEGNELSRTPAITANINPPVQGASEWEFIDE